LQGMFDLTASERLPTVVSMVVSPTR
jgi:hypothetical protein